MSAVPERNEEEARWAEWMRAAQAGDAEPYRKLLHELRIFLQRYLSGLVPDTAVRDDCIQEALLGLHRSRHTWNPSRPFRPWALTIVRNKVWDTLRQPDPWRELSADIPAPETSEGWHRHEAAVDLARVLDRLPAVQREAILLAKIEGCSLREVAERTGASVGAVKTRIHRGLRVLEREWEEGEMRRDGGSR